jgi:chloramphenicol-sensitive protein RarD
MDRGILYGVAAYGIWGLVPVYWKLFQHVGSLQVLAHRIVWSFVALFLVTSVLQWRKPSPWRQISFGVAGLYLVAALLIGINWFLYVWAVNAGFIVETSLGYFVTPLVNVLLGVLVFRERLRAPQWVAVTLAAGGVLHLTHAYGSLPWIAIGLATSFGTYGLAKKKAPLGPLEGLTLETAMLVVPALAYLIALHLNGTGVFTQTGAKTDMLLAGGGWITIGPLLLFAAAVRRVPLSVIGILQYIAPTIQLVLGVAIYHEPFARTQLVGFAFVWTALVVFAADGVRARRVPHRLVESAG